MEVAFSSLFQYSLYEKENLDKILQNYPDFIKYRDDKGRSALWCACCLNEEAAHRLLDLGSDPFAVDNDHRGTTVTCAAGRGFSVILERLLKLGVRPSKWVDSWFQGGMYSFNCKVVELLLDCKCYDIERVDYRERGMNLLGVCGRWPNSRHPYYIDLAKLLLRRGADWRMYIWASVESPAPPIQTMLIGEECAYQMVRLRNFDANDFKFHSEVLNHAILQMNDNVFRELLSFFSCYFASFHYQPTIP